MDSSSYAISTAIARTQRRLDKWKEALASLPDGPVELGALTKAFPGINEEGGAFRAHLELARLAIALKRRVIVLQAVDHAQQDTNNTFKSFIGTLRDDERSINELESGISAVLHRLSTLELKRQGGFRSPVFMQGEVDDLLKAVYRLRALGEGLTASPPNNSDVAIEIERSGDGSLVVFPAVAV